MLVGVFGEDTAENGKDSPVKKANGEYLLVANRDAFHARTATLNIAGKDAKVQRMDKQSAKWVDVPVETNADATQVRIELEDGGGELLKVVRHQVKK